MKSHELNLPDKSRVQATNSSPAATQTVAAAAATVVGSQQRKIACDTERDRSQCRPPTKTTCCCSGFTLSPSAHKPLCQQPATLIGSLTWSGNNFRPSEEAKAGCSCAATASNDLGGVVVQPTMPSAAVGWPASCCLVFSRRSSGIDRAGRESQTRSSSSLATHSIELVNVTGGGDQWCRIRLLVGLCLLAVHALDCMSSPVSGLPAAAVNWLSDGIQRTGSPYLDEHCNQMDPSSASRGDAGHMLLMLKCDIKPLFEQFEQAYGKEAVSSIGTSNEVDVGDEFGKISANIGGFVDDALGVVDHLNGSSNAQGCSNRSRNLCLLPTSSRDVQADGQVPSSCDAKMVDRMRDLQLKARKSKLLRDVFNLVAIEFHRSCLEQIIPTLPTVPALVRDVVQIYIDGADRPLEVKGHFVGYQDRKFDVDAAIKRSGSLSRVVGLSLAIGSAAKLEDFIGKCRTLVQQIEMRWTVLSTMEKLFDEKDNSILWLNNAVLRSLPTTRFADICSQLSARALESN